MHDLPYECSVCQQPITTGVLWAKFDELMHAACVTDIENGEPHWVGPVVERKVRMRADPVEDEDDGPRWSDLSAPSKFTMIGLALAAIWLPAGFTILLGWGGLCLGVGLFGAVLAIGAVLTA